jgi:3-oxoacyl-[acyl-carrier protein] reductase
MTAYLENSFKDRVALVTGGAGGLGSAITEMLAQAGAAVAVCGRDEKRMRQAADGMAAKTKARIIPQVLNLHETGAAERVVADVVKQLGRLDILINTAGAPVDGRFEEVPGPAWRTSFEVKFFGALDMIRAALPHLKASKHGVVVTLSGMLGFEPQPINIVSGSINAAIGNAMKALATDLARYNIRVLTLCPGPFYTDRIQTMLKREAAATSADLSETQRRAESSVPLGRFGQPSELAELVAFMVSDHARFLTGTTITLDGGARRSV